MPIPSTMHGNPVHYGNPLVHHAEKFLETRAGVRRVEINGQNIAELIAQFAYEYTKHLQEELEYHRERVRRFECVPRMITGIGRRYREVPNDSVSDIQL